MSFLIFCNGMFVNKSRRVPPFTFFGTMRLPLKENFFSKISIFFQKSVLRFLSLRYGADFRRSRLVSSDYNPHTDRSTFLTILTILKSYNSYLANLKYWRKSLRSSIFTSSKKLKGPKGTPSLEYFRRCEIFFRKNF